MPTYRSARPSLAPTALLTVFVTAAVFAPLAASPVAATPPPEDVCGACGTHFESAVEDAGGSVTVTESTLDVWVFDNGSAWVVAENQLAGGGADWVRDHRERVVSELAGGDDGLVPVPSDATINVVHDRVYVAHAAPGFAHTSVGGVVLVDAFRDTPSTGWEVNADTFRLYAPDNHEFTFGPGDAGESHAPAVEDGVAEWEHEEHPDAAFVASAPDDGVVSTVATRLAIGIETGPRFVVNAALVLAVPVLALAGLLRGFDALVSRVDSPGEASGHRFSTTRLGTGVAVVSAAVVAGVAASGQATTYFMLPGTPLLFTALTGVAVGALAATKNLGGARTVGAVAVGTPLALGALAAIVGATAHPEIGTWTVVRALASGLLAAQVWVFAVLGVIRTRSGVGRWRRLALVAAPLVGVVALLGPSLILAVAVAAWVVLLAVFALPAYWLGASLRHAGVRSV